MSPSQRIVSRISTLILTTFLASCIALAGGNDEADTTPFSYLALLGSQSGRPAPVNVSSSPSVQLSQNAGLPASVIQVTESSVQLPSQIDGSYIPVGKVYDVGPNTEGQDIPGHLYLPNGGQAKLTYEYDAEALESAGFLDEFAAFYFDKDEQKWLPVERIEVDRSTQTVTAFTSHFTPFVLTAIPAASGNIADAPACIAEDYPSGISGSAGAVFTIVDTDFKYYKDRTYTINRTGGDFDTLAFNGALAISVCNGNSPCGTYGQHKQFTGSNYIQFTAHTNIDLYLMYDTRGGTGLFDTSRDAPWIAAAGFVNTGNFVNTTDAVGKYRVYKKSYNKGDLVTLDGNRKGVTVPGIDTNYWIVMKRQGVTDVEPASKLCEKNPALTPTMTVSNARIAPGANQMILGFQTPDDEDFAGVVIRRSTTAALARIGDGAAPTGTVLSPTGYRDEALAPNTQYFYTIFALDRNGAYGPGVSVSAQTGPDPDGDGLSTSFEDTFVYPSGQKSNPSQQDTDGDGVSDGAEFENGTDSRNVDNVRPIISLFQLTTPSVTNNPIARFNLNGSDNVAITGWKLTVTDTPPVSWGSGWNATRPAYHQFTRAGNHNLRAWAVDAAGNVNLIVGPQNVNIDGINIARYLYMTDSNASLIRSYNIDMGAATLTPNATTSVNASPLGIALSANEQHLYLGNGGGNAMSRFQVNGQTGALTLLDQVSAFYNPVHIGVDPTGGRFFVAAQSLGGVDAVFDTSGTLSLFGHIGMSAAETKWIIIHPTGGSIYTAIRNFATDDGLVIIHQFNNVTGATAEVQRAFVPSIINSIVMSPDRRFLYASGNGIYAFSVSTDPSYGLWPIGWQVQNATFEQMLISPDGTRLYALCYGNNLMYVFSRDINTGALTSLYQTPTGSNPWLMAMDETGRIIFAPTPVSNNVAIFTLDDSGDVISNKLVSMPAGNPAIYHQHDGNDPPQVKAGKDRWVTVGQSAALHGHGTIDTDAVRCNSSASNYVSAWTIVSKPATSTLTDAQIIDGNTLGSARFVPDVSGDYVFRLTFTDDPGKCQGSAKTNSAIVTIRAGYKHTSAIVDQYDSLPPGPDYDPVFVNTGTAREDWGGDMMYAISLKGDPVQYAVCVALRAHFDDVCTDPGSWLVPWRAAAACALRNSMNCESQFDLVYTIICLSPEANRPDAQNFCELVAANRPQVLVNGNVVTFDLHRGHFWTHMRWRDHYVGRWEYWDYN